MKYRVEGFSPMKRLDEFQNWLNQQNRQGEWMLVSYAAQWNGAVCEDLITSATLCKADV